MNTLILEDDFICRVALQRLLSPHGESHVAVNGVEAVRAFQKALDRDEPYDLVCLDIMVPELGGQEVLKAMRAAEASQGIYSGNGSKIIMTTALDDMKNVMAAYSELCDGYIPKPVTRKNLAAILQELKLVQPGSPAAVASVPQKVN